MTETQTATRMSDTPPATQGQKASPPRRISPRTKRLAALALVLGGWESFARVGVLDPFYAPPPTDVGAVLAELFVSGDIWTHLQATFTAALLGLVIGVVVGGLLGFAAALSPTLSELTEPVMIALNAVPRIVLAPLFLIWFGIGIGSKIALAFLLVSVLIFFSVFSGIKEVDQRLVERVRSFGGGTRTLVREVYWPSVTAWVMSNIKVAVGFAFTGAVVGEFVAATRGLGYLLSFAQSQFNTPLVLALIGVVMAFVLVLFGGAAKLERRLLHWRYG
jgi:NitT/TauT family transport system permease protein